MIIVAIRGTQKAMDIVVDLRSYPYNASSGGESFRFHKGFYKCLSRSIEKLYNKLQTKLVVFPKTPVYVTGHSLGGAMAAILHALWGITPSGCTSHFSPNDIVTNSAYTFGMPRYGNKKVVTGLANPYHLYNENDIIPSIPPKWLCFRNCNEEYQLDGNTCTQKPNRPFTAYDRIHGAIFRRYLSNHSMVKYHTRICQFLNIP
jgi:predicted lipase